MLRMYNAFVNVFSNPSGLGGGRLFRLGGRRTVGRGGLPVKRVRARGFFGTKFGYVTRVSPPACGSHFFKGTVFDPLGGLLNGEAILGVF